MKADDGATKAHDVGARSAIAAAAAIVTPVNFIVMISSILLCKCVVDTLLTDAQGCVAETLPRALESTTRTPRGLRFRTARKSFIAKRGKGLRMIGLSTNHSNTV